MSKTLKIIIGILIAVAVISACCIGGLLLKNLLNKPAEPTPTTVPATSAPVDTVQPPAADDSWDRIQAAGKIIVGTSADYPPFESYVRPGEIDGFDVALMDEIGRRLGVQVEYRDIAFDGLGPALSLGQIDAAIAAISRTPEREAEVDFSNVYLVSEDGILAKTGSGIVINSADDLPQYRIGVQRNSVYQSWLQEVLIDTGRMSPGNLFAYEKAGDAIRDLQESRIDLVIMDAQAAQAFVEQGGVEMVAKGLNAQNYAIALPKGAAALKAKIDEVITELYNDGTIGRLSQQYLGLPTVLPTPTPAPTSTPAPPPSCVDGLTLVKHLTQEDNMAPGQGFTKGWQVQNTGTCPWSAGYKLVFVDGYQMGGQPLALTQEVPPGGTYDLQLNLVAPLQAGSYQGVWQMTNAQGKAFGERLKVNVKVVAAPTVTPAPTQTPVPGITFTVDRNLIKAGECVNFYWKVDNVKAVYFYKEGEKWQDHGVTGEETRRECPPATITYYLRVVKPDNAVDVRQITIYVEAAPEAPAITRFTVDPPGQITLGQCVTIRWKVEGQIDGITLTANDAVLWQPAPVEGTFQDCPTAVGAVAYGIEAVGPGGTSHGQQTVNVVEAATATPVPTAAPEQPVIHSFSVSPNQIAVGECVGLAWSVGGGATYSRILRNGMVIVDNAGF
ncbi:MAG TPA: transporter substrate-binding domain-containing protein, partial [Anaerolineae bacterium]|nr:transporter substrate-binding domain-containing protein [Anaerolineae bacterium]